MVPLAKKQRLAGETMINRTLALSTTARTETARDILMVSTFGFWAFLLGFAPMLAISLFGGH
jgi:hypothetical protein